MISQLAALGLTFIVATLVYSWQRAIEHAYLLRREKRDLYARVLKHATRLRHDLITGKMDKTSEYSVHSENSFEANLLQAELRVYESAGVSYVFEKLLAKCFEKAKVGYDPSLGPEGNMSELNELKLELENEIVIDLQQTVVHIAWAKKKRYRFAPSKSGSDLP